MTSEPGGFRAISKRAVPLIARRDLVTMSLFFRGVRFRAVKDPIGLKYFHLQPEQYLVLDLLDGCRSLEDIRDEVQREFPTIPVSLSDVQSLTTDLHQKGLVLGTRPGQGVSIVRQRREARRKKLLQAVSNPFFVRLPGWDPDVLLSALNRWLGWTFSRPLVLSCLLIVCASWLQVAIRFDDLRQRLPEFQQFFGWPNLLYLWLTLGLSKALHEIGHGLACKRHGCECHAIGFSLLVFSPTLYCDATDSWMLADKWKRMRIGAAGMYVEVLLAAIAVFLWSQTHPGLLNHLCLNVFFVSTITTVIFNANPLIRFDGYYILSDWLEIPNLRTKATLMLQRVFAWCFGLDVPEHPLMPKSGQVWFVSYAIASWCYRWLIVFGIFVGLYTMLKPRKLQSVGIAWGCITGTILLIGLVAGIRMTIKSRKHEPVSWGRFAFTATALSALLVAAVSVPLPIYRKAPFYLEPDGVQDVYAMVPGVLEDVRVRAGQGVRQGELLFVFGNPELADEYRKTALHRQVAESEAASLRLLDDHEAFMLKCEELNQIDRTLAELRTQIGHLEVRAPCDGVVVPPPRVVEPKLEQRRDRLPTWSGTPLERRNLLCFVEERTHLCSIAPEDRYRAVLLIDQHDRADIRVGQRVDLKAEHLAGVTLHGAVAEIAHQNVEFAPRLLSNKFGGQLPTMTDSLGRERLTSEAYEMAVRFDGRPDLFRSAQRGEARFLVTNRSAAGWAWRYIQTNIRFRL